MKLPSRAWRTPAPSSASRAPRYTPRTSPTTKRPRKKVQAYPTGYVDSLGESSGLRPTLSARFGFASTCQHTASRLVSTLRLAPSFVSTPAAQACQHFPLRPRLIARDEPLPAVVGLDAHGVASRQLPESDRRERAKSGG